MKLRSLVALAVCTLSLYTLSGCNESATTVEKYREVRHMEDRLSVALSGDLLLADTGKICVIQNNFPDSEFIHINCKDGRPGPHRRYYLAVHIREVISQKEVDYDLFAARFGRQ